jgi:hypothetical protein
MTTSLKPSKIFGAGDFYGVNNVDVPTPALFDTVQDQTISIKRAVKKLMGTGQFPADISAADMDITGKVTCASLNGRAFADLMFGAAVKWQEDRLAKRERHKVANDDKVKVANAAGFQEDLGVIDPATNRPFTRVAVGKALSLHTYSCTSKGVYVVNSAWDGEDLDFSYRYTLDATDTSVKQTLVNQEMGATGTFTAVHSFNWRQEQNVVVLNSCIMTDTEIGGKQADYGKLPWSYMASADDYDVLGTFSFAQRR